MRDKFVAALRSGDFKQGTGQFYNTDDVSYCCLGVACEVAHNEGQLGGGWHDDEGWRTTGGDRLGGFCWMVDVGDQKFDIAGLHKLFGLSESQTKKLARMNDDHKSFDEIADHIESL